MDNVIEKIRKLLALAGSNNDNEARAAMLKARKLLAQYKLSEKDISTDKKAELRRAIYQEHTYSGKKNWWFVGLARVIAENHCCHACGTVEGKSSVFRVTFAGLDDDPMIALELFGYAVQFIMRKEKDCRIYFNRRVSDQAARNAMVYDWMVNYADGFTKGLEAQYAEQFKQAGDECMALALVKPVEVERFAASLATRNTRVRKARAVENAARLGWTEGYKFNPTKQIATGDPVKQIAGK